MHRNCEITFAAFSNYVLRSLVTHRWLNYYGEVFYKQCFMGQIPQQKGSDLVSPSSLLPLLGSGDHQSPTSFCLLTLWSWNFLAETWDNPRACVICFLFLRDYYPSWSNVQCLENYGFIILHFFFSCFSWKGKSDP